MSASLTSTEFKVVKFKRSAQKQITDYLREEIYKGNLKPGVKLPSNLEFAARWETHGNTVQLAMGSLMKEGLLVRIPGTGTFVRKREEKLTCVGVYCTNNVKGAPYATAVREALSRELHETGIEMDLWMDPRPRDQYREPWMPLLKAAESRRFQAFIATETNLPLFEWQRKLPVPAAFVAMPAPIQNSVDHDMRQFFEIGLRELLRQGCRNIGFIFPALHRDISEGNTTGRLDLLYHFTDVAGDLGLTVKNDWMRIFADRIGGTELTERFGYEQFLELWNLPEKPEGLLVFTDVVARGVLMAIREKQVRVPEDLKLALHKNESIDLFCSMPATFVVGSEREMARALIGQVQKQFRGESCERISLPFKLVAHTQP